MHLFAQNNQSGQLKSMRTVNKKVRGGSMEVARPASRPDLTVRHAPVGPIGRAQSHLDAADYRSDARKEIARNETRTGELRRECSMAAASNSDGPVEVVISRSTSRHCWVILMGGHSIPLPWVDSTDACTVASWVKANASGKVKVQIRL